MANKKQESRVRNWTIVLYPESAPDNWRDIIEDFHIEWVESPLHEFDLNADGQPKKAHYHILLMFSGVKSYEQVLELIQPLNCPIPQRCHNSKAMVRYFAHLDNPEKYQYNPSDVKVHGGADLHELLRPSSSERYTYIKEMVEFCEDNNIVEFCDLTRYAMQFRYEDWFPLLCDNSAFVMQTFLKSKRHSAKAPTVAD